MQKIISILYKAIRRLIVSIRKVFDYIISWKILYANNVKFSTFKTNGIPYVMIARGGKCSIGKNFVMNNGLKGNPIGRAQRCILVVDKNAELQIGNGVGMSSTAIVAHKSIIIKDNVKIGGNVCIYDTDFHSLDAKTRASKNDFSEQICKEVMIESNAFIGAHSTILKGVHIGENAIVGACSVVTKDIPANEIWAGNPAKFIKRNPVNQQ